MVTCVNDYKPYILIAMENLDNERELQTDSEGPFYHCSSELYFPVRQLMAHLLTEADHVIRNPDDAGSEVFKSQMRSALNQLKAEGLVECAGRKKGWRRVIDSLLIVENHTTF